MSDQKKKPAHELLVDDLEGFVGKVGEKDKQREAIILIAYVLKAIYRVVVPEEHLAKTVERLRKIADNCTIDGLAKDIVSLADHLSQEG